MNATTAYQVHTSTTTTATVNPAGDFNPHLAPVSQFHTTYAARATFRNVLGAAYFLDGSGFTAAEVQEAMRKVTRYGRCTIGDEATVTLKDGITRVVVR